jgi:hypothetical protein
MTVSNTKIPKVKIPISEYTKTDSQYSAMRLGFFWMVKTDIIIAVISVIAIVVAGLLDKHIDATSLVAIITALGVSAFGGKALQSRAESLESQGNDQTDKITDVITNLIQTKSQTETQDPNDQIQH